jgi:hypothetical protein
MVTDFYAKKLGINGLRHIDREEVKKYNQEGWDIFFTPQKLKDGDRKKENLEELRFLCGDFDNVSLNDLRSRLKFCLLPSLIIQTRSGFHCYWKLKNPIPNSPGLADTYHNFVQSTLVAALGADPKASDVSRILRVPETRYWADSKGNYYDNEVIMNKTLYKSGRDYTWTELDSYLPRRSQLGRSMQERKPAPTYKPLKVTQHLPQVNKVEKTPNFWAAANTIPTEEAFNRLSGSHHVGGEQITLKPIGAGKKRILINGKARHMWLDPDGAIGSADGGGPTIVNWLNWYHKDMKKVAEILKEVFHDYVG